MCLGDSDGDGKDDLCVPPPPGEGCCWRCVGNTLECDSPTTQQSCPGGWNFVGGENCGSNACGLGECDVDIPTVSEWGLIIMAVLLLAGAKIYFGRRRAAQA